MRAALERPTRSGPRIGPIAATAAAFVLLFVAGALGWSLLVPVNSAILAEGRVVVQSYRKNVQTRDGGRIVRILAAEGERVAAGQSLIRLDPAEAWAEHDLLRARLLQALGRQSRLSASMQAADAPVWPEELSSEGDNPEAARVTKTESTLFTASEEERKGKEKVLEKRIDELAQEIRSLRAQLQSADRQLPMLEEEAADVALLLAKGLERKPRLLALRRAREALLGERNALRGKIAQAEENLAAAELNLAAFRNQTRTALAEDLTRTSNEIAALRQEVRSARTKLRNTDIKAPVSGEVVDLAVHTIGGVVGPGETLLSIVPQEDELVVDVRIDAGDIDAIYRGQMAEIRVRAFRWRDRAPLAARVVRVSADLLEEPRTGRQYYEARLRFEKPDGTGDLKVGMAADAALLTEERTAADYLLGPVARALFRGFREP